MPSLQLVSRQLGISECVATCMTSGDLTGCSSILDYACICQSAAYQSSVATCWTGCDPEEVAIGQSFSQQRCSAEGITLPSSFSSGISASMTASISAVASMTSIAITGTPESWLEAPRLYERTLLNIQAIMSSICAALFIVAIVFGVLSCRARIRRERGQTSSQWSAAGTFGDRTKFDPTSSRFHPTSTNPGTGARFPNGQSQTDTFMSSLEDYRNTVSLPSRPAAAAGGARFTNRMSVPVPEEEEWELKEVKTPTSATTMSTQQDQVGDKNGSSEALNQVQVLDKHGRAI